MIMKIQNKKITWVYLIACIIFVYTIFYLAKKPSHSRDWESGQGVLPKILISESDVKIINYRDYLWDADGHEEVYRDYEFSVSEIDGLDVFISHFSESESVAHIFLSFSVANGDNVVISLESRREKGEKFSPFLGLFRQYEIIYIVGSESDIIGLRTGVRDERVFHYPVNASREGIQKLFTELAVDINTIYDNPKFYNTLLHNCTNELTRSVEKISDISFPLTWKILFPGRFDEVLYDLKLIPHNESFTNIEKRHEIDNELLDHREDDYSQRLRQDSSS